MSLRFAELDATDPAAVEGYERAFHAAFSRVSGNRLIRDLWLWDDPAARLATRIPYHEQIVLLGWNAAGEIETAMSFNFAMREFQSSAFGFAPPEPTEGTCELIVFFTLGHRHLSRVVSNLIHCYAEMRARGFHTAYATTAPRPLPTYRRIGGTEVVDEREIDGEMRYFLRVDLARFQGREGSSGLVLDEAEDLHDR
jgi:hypothetical protein